MSLYIIVITITQAFSPMFLADLDIVIVLRLTVLSTVVDVLRKPSTHKN